MTKADRARNLVVFTDLDGSLLDERTYAWAPAREARMGTTASATRRARHREEGLSIVSRGEGAMH